MTHEEEQGAREVILHDAEIAKAQVVADADYVRDSLQSILEGFKEEEEQRRTRAAKTAKRRFWGVVAAFVLICGLLGGYVIQQRNVLSRLRTQDTVACVQRGALSKSTKQAFLAEYDLIGRPTKPPRSASDQAAVDAFVKDSKSLVELSFPPIDCSHAGGH